MGYFVKIFPYKPYKKMTNKLFCVNTKRDDSLKIIAAASMLVDHIGFIFFPQVEFLRIIGRLALPIFAVGIANGYGYTSNIKKYLSRLLIFALISQIPFMLAINDSKLNIIFSFFVSLTALYAIDKKKYIILISVIFFFFMVPVEYGFYGLLMVVIFFIFKRQDIILIGQTIITSLYCLGVGSYRQLFSIFGILLVLFYPYCRAVGQK